MFPLASPSPRLYFSPHLPFSFPPSLQHSTIFLPVFLFCFFLTKGLQEPTLPLHLLCSKNDLELLILQPPPAGITRVCKITQFMQPWGSNPRPCECQASAFPTQLHPQPSFHPIQNLFTISKNLCSLAVTPHSPSAALYKFILEMHSHSLLISRQEVSTLNRDSTQSRPSQDLGVAKSENHLRPSLFIFLVLSGTSSSEGGSSWAP